MLSKQIFDSLIERAERTSSRWVARGWPWLDSVMRAVHPASKQPRWAPAPLSRTRSKPPLGWPRQTDSLCPECVKRVRQAIVDGEQSHRILIEGHPGEIRATIRERDGKIIIEKDCPEHGHFEDVLSINPEFLSRIESLFFGRDFESPKSVLRNHGTSSIRYGRGSVLTVDLTNRCNMMCEPCFMDANQVGYVHEPDWETIQKILDDSLTIQPRRQLSVQFSGGEPTLSPLFLDAIRYARKIGYFCVQSASNGIRFAQDPSFCRAAKAAGLRLVYLQFDGTSNEAHKHRKVGNLYDIKERAIENLHAAGIDVVLVVTVVRGVNDSEVGRVVQFAIDHADKITVVSFQPVSFTGRDEDISEVERIRKRYTLSHLARDLEAQFGVLRPMRDWFPLSAMTPFGDLVDLMNQSHSELGALNCGCHPNCGIGSILLVHKQTKQVIPLSQIIDIDQFLTDLQSVADWQQRRTLSLLGLAAAVIKNFRADEAPSEYRLRELIRQGISQMGISGGEVGKSEGDAHEFPWRFLFVAGMWFQDLWTYDFRRTEMCIIPQGTQMGEISFCAYNTGVGWRQVVEKLYRTKTTAEWYREHGRHPVYARGQRLSLPGDAIPMVQQPTADGRRRLRLVG